MRLYFVVARIAKLSTKLKVDLMLKTRLHRFMFAFGIGLIWHSVFGYVSVAFAVGVAIAIAAVLAHDRTS